MLDGITSVATSTDEDGVGTSRALEGELVEGHDLTTGSSNAGAGGGGDTEGADLEALGDHDAGIISDGANDDNNLVVLVVLVVALVVAGKEVEGHDGAVDAGHHKTLEHDLVEGSAGAAGEELVELHKETNVDVL